MRPRKDFFSDRQYKKYLLAVKYAEKIKHFQDKGYLIIDEDGDVLEGTIEIPDNDYWIAVKHVYGDGKCSFGLICFAYGSDGIPWIDETMKDIHAIFKGYRIVNPKNIHRLTISKPKPIKKVLKNE